MAIAQTPLSFSRDLLGGASSASGSIAWNAEGATIGTQPLFGTPSNLPIPTVIVQPIGGTVRIPSVRGIVVDNRFCRSPVVVSSPDQVGWHALVPPLSVVHTPCYMGAAAIRFEAPIGTLTNDITYFTLSTEAIHPHVFDANGSGLGVPTIGAVGVGPGQFSPYYINNISFSAFGTLVIANEDCLLTEWEMVLSGFAASTGGLFSATLQDGQGNRLAAWYFNVTSTQPMPPVTIFDKSFRRPFYQKCQFITNASTAVLTAGTINIRALVQ